MEQDTEFQASNPATTLPQKPSLWILHFHIYFSIVSAIWTIFLLRHQVLVLLQKIIQHVNQNIWHQQSWSWLSALREHHHWFCRRMFRRYYELPRHDSADLEHINYDSSIELEDYTFDSPIQHEFDEDTSDKQDFPWSEQEKPSDTDESRHERIFSAFRGILRHVDSNLAHETGDYQYREGHKYQTGGKHGDRCRITGVSGEIRSTLHNAYEHNMEAFVHWIIEVTDGC